LGGIKHDIDPVKSTSRTRSRFSFLLHHSAHRNLEGNRVAPKTNRGSQYVAPSRHKPFGVLLSQPWTWRIKFSALVAGLFFSFFAVQSVQAQTLTATDLYGCWRRDAPRRIGEERVGFTRLCFRSDRTVYQISFIPEGREFSGGDELKEWQLIPNGTLVIDGESCLVMPGSKDASLFLARCTFLGAWVRQCTHMTEDGTGCPSREQRN
jgi:hypothetical protein